MKLLASSNGSFRLNEYKLPWLSLSIFLLCFTVLGTEYARWGVSITRTILPWEFPAPIIISFILTGISVGIYVLKNPNNFYLNVSLFLLFSSSVGTLGWSVMDEFCMLFIALALLFLIKNKKLKVRNHKHVANNKLWIFLFFTLAIFLLSSSLLGVFAWGQYKAIRFSVLFFSILVFAYSVIYYQIEFGKKEETITKILYCSAIYFFLLLLIGTFSVIFEPQSTLVRLLFIFRGLGDVSYVNAMFPAIISVPLSFYLLSNIKQENKLLIFLNIMLPFLASMLMDTRSGFLIFVLCIVMLPIALGPLKTFKLLSIGIAFSVLTTTILIDQPFWFFEAFGSLTEVFNIEGGSYILDYHGTVYAASKGDIGRFMFAYCSLLAAIDQPIFFLTGTGNYSYFTVMEPYLTTFRIENNIQDFTAIEGTGGEQPRPPALGAWIIENGIIGFTLILGNITSTFCYLFFYKKNGNLFLEQKETLLLIIPVIIIPIWAYFAEFQENTFLYLMIMPFGFMYLLKGALKN